VIVAQARELGPVHANAPFGTSRERLYADNRIFDCSFSARPDELYFRFGLHAPVANGRLTMEADKTERREIRWGLITSIALHVAVLVLILLKLSVPTPTPAEENSIQVSLVPPPEDKKSYEKPPEPPKQEQAKKEEPPPKPPEPAKKEEPPPKPPEPVKKEPIPVLQKAVEFGQKDSGPKKSTDGDAAEEEAKKADDVPADQPAEATAAAAKPEAATPPAPKATEPLQVQGTDVPSDLKAPEGNAAASVVLPAEKPVQEAKLEEKSSDGIGKPAAKLTKARKLFSKKESSDPFARLAMGMVPRDERFSRLCGTELLAQLRHGSYSPVLIPSAKGPRGNVLDLEDGAFRDTQGWYELSFRCEVDNDAMRVLSFAYNVGKAVPRNEWKSRGFPER
jgi:hypothetical protein